MDDEWRKRLVEQLLGANAEEDASERATFAPDGSTAMEIAFGKARSELTYVLELGRAHHLPAVGNVAGDVIWVRLGEAEARFALERATTAIVSTVCGVEARLAWDPKHRAIATPDGRLVDVELVVRDALDKVVSTFKGT